MGKEKLSLSDTLVLLEDVYRIFKEASTQLLENLSNGHRIRGRRTLYQRKIKLLLVVNDAVKLNKLGFDR